MNCFCHYCDAFEKGLFEFEKKVFTNNDDLILKNRILFETKNFLVFPTLGCFVEGYLLIASKKHFIGIGEIPLNLFNEFKKVKEKVTQVLTENYCAPVFFEHGPTSSSNKGGCCVEHAHVHCFPTKADVFNELKERFKFNEIKKLSETKNQFESKIPYFYYENSSGKKYLFHIPNAVPSQFIRQALAVKLGMSDKWNWQTNYEIEKMQKTMKKLKGKFGD